MIDGVSLMPDHEDPQQFYFMPMSPHLSVMENSLLGAEPMRYGLIDRARMRDAARRALAELGHDDILPDATVGHLSVAAQQLVEIARAIAVGCRVLVLDVLLHSSTAFWIGGVLALLGVALWVLLPLAQRRRGRREDALD